LGLRLGPLVKEFRLGKIIGPEFLRGKILVVDALVTIYQMLAMIRGPDGYFLVDSSGEITSHLVGIFNRECRMMSMGIRSIYVFDGPPHPEKLAIIEMRKHEKRKFYDQFIQAVRRGDVDKAVKLGKRAMFITDKMINETKKLLELLGIPIVQAVHDAEAQAAYMVRKGDAYALATRDWDSFLYGAPRIIMHWRITKDDYIPSKMYELKELLDKLQITHNQLIDLGMLLGTDYNPGGFSGIGPITAYKLIKRYRTIEEILKYGKIKWRWNITPEQIRKIFTEHPINKNYDINFRDPDVEGLTEFLVDEHNFNKIRVRNQLYKAIKGIKRYGAQRTLLEF